MDLRAAMFTGTHTHTQITNKALEFMHLTFLKKAFTYFM